jgi:hypothetical protein
MTAANSALLKKVQLQLTIRAWLNAQVATTLFLLALD